MSNEKYKEEFERCQERCREFGDSLSHLIECLHNVKTPPEFHSAWQWAKYSGAMADAKAVLEVTGRKPIVSNLHKYAQLAPLDLLRPREVQADLLAISKGKDPPSWMRKS